MVLIVGSVSSGKTTLINQYLNLTGDQMFATGIAPETDKFNIIAYGRERRELKGEEVLTDQKYLVGLRDENPKLINHGLGMYTRDHDKLKNLVIIDSPGILTNWGNRPYDFKKVAMWFAERVDLVLYMFSVAKPPIPEEIELYHSMRENIKSGKLITMFNMVNLAKNPGDLAKSFGTLTWQLASYTGGNTRQYELPSDLLMTYIPPDEMGFASHNNFDMGMFEANGKQVFKEFELINERYVYSTVKMLQTYVDEFYTYIYILTWLFDNKSSHAFYSQNLPCKKLATNADRLTRAAVGSLLSRRQDQTNIKVDDHVDSKNVLKYATMKAKKICDAISQKGQIDKRDREWADRSETLRKLRRLRNSDVQEIERIIRTTLGRDVETVHPAETIDDLGHCVDDKRISSIQPDDANDNDEL